jgi:hypothetical protein
VTILLNPISESETLTACHGCIREARRLLYTSDAPVARFC